MTQIRIEGLTKTYGDTRALHEVNLEIRSGELFFLLGPSGCGKSTLLRTIAGLQMPSSGRILFDGRDVTAVETQKRNAVMCFQGYALWPHMTVRENIRFGLSVRETPGEAQLAQVERALDIVQMRPLADRKPQELSGGQQQRVALARALAVQPACLLLDEPLSNLDTHLRQELRREIRRICREAGITTVYVTHDQKEALSTADRIAVMREGGLVQVGSPQELYRAPVDAFVAEFMGATNLVEGEVVEVANGVVRVGTGVGEVVAAGVERRGVADEVASGASGGVTTGVRPGGRAAGGLGGGGALAVGARVVLSIRPELIRIVPAGDARGAIGAGHGVGGVAGGAAATGVLGGGTTAGALGDAVGYEALPGGAADREHGGVNRLVGVLVEDTFLGQSSEHLVAVGDGRLSVVSAPPPYGLSGNVALEFDPADVVVLGADAVDSGR